MISLDDNSQKLIIIDFFSRDFFFIFWNVASKNLKTSNKNFFLSTYIGKNKTQYLYVIVILQNWQSSNSLNKITFNHIIINETAKYCFWKRNWTITQSFLLQIQQVLVIIRININNKAKNKQGFYKTFVTDSITKRAQIFMQIMHDATNN